MADEVPARAQAWAATMSGHASGGLVRAHLDSKQHIGTGFLVDRRARELQERQTLRPAATFAEGAGNREIPEEPDDVRTCFERDRDRLVHSTAFRRLAGKTQVVVHPTDHQRTRLTHALEVAQVATAIARGAGLNVTLAEAIALGHDCGHGPGGHASEEAFDAFIPEGFEHGPWGADVVLTGLNLCTETLDGIRNHSWARPAPSTPEGEVVSWADRIAYSAHDLEDAVHAGIVPEADLPAQVTQVAGRTRRAQLNTFVRAVVAGVVEHGEVGMPAAEASALAALRAFNYERIYVRPASLAQSRAVVEVLRALVDYYIGRSDLLPDPVPVGDEVATLRSAVAYVAGMTDRFAFEMAVNQLGWDRRRLPQGIDRGGD